MKFIKGPKKEKGKRFSGLKEKLDKIKQGLIDILTEDYFDDYDEDDKKKEETSLTDESNKTSQEKNDEEEDTSSSNEDGDSKGQKEKQQEEKEKTSEKKSLSVRREIIKVKKPLTRSDVEEFNKNDNIILELDSTKGQNPSIIALLSPNIVVRVLSGIDENELKKAEVSDEDIYSMTTYTPSELSKTIGEIQSVENSINPNWTDLEKALYVYISISEGIRPDKNKGKTESLLSGFTSKKTSNFAYAYMYREMMDRLGIPCTNFIRGVQNSWNEIKIQDEYYPLDLSWDADYYDENRELGICNFLTNKEFYDHPLHEVDAKVSRNTINQEFVEEALKVVSQREYQVEEKPEIIVHSKELAGVFDGNVVTEETVSQKSEKTQDNSSREVVISLTDSNLDTLTDDIKNIVRYYPEVLSNIKLENKTSTHIDMQQVIDSIYDARLQYERTSFDATDSVITIESDLTDDFDLDFSKAPKTNSTNRRVIEDSEAGQKIVFRNTNPSAIKLPSFKDKLSANIDCIEFENFDMVGVDIEKNTATKIVLKGGNTINIAAVSGINSIARLELNGISQSEFDQFMTTILPVNTNLFDLDIENQSLAGRRILEEIANANSNIAKLFVYNCGLDNVEGLELFNGRLGSLLLTRNNLGVNEIERLQNFSRTPENRFLNVKYSKNAEWLNYLRTQPSLSIASQNLMRSYFHDSGAEHYWGLNTYDSASLIDSINASFDEVPYYIQDAQLMRETLNYIDNPIRIENNNQIDTFDFTVPYMQGANILLTKDQIEYLINSGKEIPQNISVMISSVKDLDTTELRDLRDRLAAANMTLTNVQIINRDNSDSNSKPYTLAEYNYARNALDQMVGDIDLTLPEIDRFAEVYVRIAQAIEYDHDAVDPRTRDEQLYVSEKRDTCRNLIEGLADGKCVCAGYADILRNALSLVNINSRYIVGQAHPTEISGHAWSQVQIDGTWYGTDVTWDALKGKTNSDAQRRAYTFPHTLVGEAKFNADHARPSTPDRETMSSTDYDRTALLDAMHRAMDHYIDFRETIEIPDDPALDIQLDDARITEEYTRRKNDMYAKFYGNRDYQHEYEERAARYRSHEIDRSLNGYDYRTVEDYAEREEDEKFLILEEYKNSLERMTLYDAGDTSVYSGTPDEIREAYEKDKEYVETRNHTFDQHKNTQKDLATLGKYGEKMPYIPKQQGALRNVGRAIGNGMIFVRNLWTPIYRGIGRFVAQPVHRLVTGGRDASPYRNNFYHRMVARRDYFMDMAMERDEAQTEALRNEAIANGEDPAAVKAVSHPFRNMIASRFNAIFKAKEGNEAVLRAGAYDIRQNIEAQERDVSLVTALNTQKAAYEQQIKDLQDLINTRPTANNIAKAKQALANKQAALAQIDKTIYDKLTSDKIESIQTDAVSADLHAIASKEVNTARVAVIKGVAKIATAKFVGPKIKDWLLERGKTVQETTMEVNTIETHREWVPTTYKDVEVSVTETQFDTDISISELASRTSGRSYTMYETVSGGNVGPQSHVMNEQLTGIWIDNGTKWGTGLSDKIGLTQATGFTDRTFPTELLDASGALRPDVSVRQLLDALDSSSVDPSTLGGIYVSAGDRGWIPLSDLMGEATREVTVSSTIESVVDVQGHFETIQNAVTKTIPTTIVVDNLAVIKTVEVGGKAMKGILGVDTAVDLVENLRNTTTDVKPTKKKKRNYTYNDGEEIITSKTDYDREERD